MGLRPLDLAGLSEIEGTPQRMNEAVWTIKNVSFAYKHEPETLHITETSFKNKICHASHKKTEHHIEHIANV